MQPHEVIADYQHRAALLGARAREVQAQIAAIRGVDTSSDGAVTVTVNVQGALEALSFGPAAQSLSLTELGQVIVAASRKARARAARQAAQAVEPLVGANSAAMQELRERIPSDASLEDSVERPDRDGLNEEDAERASAGPAPAAAPTPPPVPPAPPAPSRPAPRSADDGPEDEETGYTRGG